MMYNFIFYVMYHRQLKMDGDKVFARYNGAFIVFFALLVHLVLLGAIFRKFYLHCYGIDMYINNKAIIALFVIGFMILTCLYYNKKRAERVLSAYSSDLDPVRSGNIVKVVSILFIPLAVAIFLSRK